MATDHVRRQLTQPSDVDGVDPGAAQVEHDTELRHGVGDGPVVVHPAGRGHVGMYRLVDHDRVRACLPGVPRAEWKKTPLSQSGL